MSVFVIALTGSIGMGKTTTAQMFADEGIPVWSADDAVHRLYARDGAGVRAIQDLHPDAIVDGAVDRNRLAAWIGQDATRLNDIEARIHPLVAADRSAFLSNTAADIALVDIPLLFETGAQDVADLIVVVSAPKGVQRARVLDRPDMTEDRFDLILSKQLPDAEKRARADVVIETISLEAARSAVQTLLSDIRKTLANA